MNVVSHAPRPGSKSGVADYAEALAPALRSISGPQVQGETHLYHIGNNKLHAEIYTRALAKPGVIVLHDAVLHHLMLGTLSADQYLAEWILNYGEWHRELGEELWRDRARSGTDLRYFRYPMLRRIVEASRGVIVHNPGAAALAREHGAKNIATVPHFFDPPAEPFHAAEIADYRRSINIAPNATLFGIFGYLRETKRVMPCLASFRRLHAARPDTALLLAGDAVSPDLDRLLRAEVAHPAIRRLGHLTDRDLQLAAASIDCCLNLRYPAAGETSGIAIRMMGAGKTVIVSDVAENADFPETAVLRVTPGLAEAAELFAQMALVTEYPAIRRQIGDLAAAHIRTHHSLDIVARQYTQILLPH
jgi:glycosyltransferase involved in cell wall biosynthesis